MLSTLCHRLRSLGFVLLAGSTASAAPLATPFDLYEAGPLGDEALAPAAADPGEWLVVHQERRDERTWLLLALPDGTPAGELPGWGRPRYLGRVRSGERLVYAAPPRDGERLRTGRGVTVSPSGGSILVTRESPAEIAQRAPHGFRMLERTLPLAAPRPEGPPAAFAKNLQKTRRPAARAESDVFDLIAGVDPDSLREYVRTLSETDLGNSTSRYYARNETEIVAKSYIETKLREALGPGTVFNHAFDMFTPPPLVEPITVHNVYGRHASAAENAGAILLTAHYDAIGTRSDRDSLCVRDRDPGLGCDCESDSVASDPACAWDWETEPAPGADDNASGVAALLEAARLLSGLSFDFDLYFVAFQGEELGLIGSAAFADSLAAGGQDVFAVINLDMIAHSLVARRLDIVTNEGSEWIADYLLETQQRFVGTLPTTKFVEFFGRSDHASFWAAGMDAVLLIEDKNVVYPQYHTFQDDWAALDDPRSQDQFESSVQLLVAAIGRFALHHESPDLAIPNGEIFVRPLGGDEPRTGAPNSLTARIFNFGTSELVVGTDTTETLTVRVSFHDGDPEAGGSLIARETRTDFFPAGGFVDFETVWTPPVGAEGFHEIFVTVEGLDPGYEENEVSTANNRGSANVFFGGETPQVLLHYPFPNPQRGSFGDLSLSYQLTSPAEVTITIYDLAGEFVGRFFADGSQIDDGNRTGINTITGRQFRTADQRSVTVDSGVYVYVIQISDRTGQPTDTSTGKFAVVK